MTTLVMILALALLLPVVLFYLVRAGYAAGTAVAEFFERHRVGVEAFQAIYWGWLLWVVGRNADHWIDWASCVMAMFFAIGSLDSAIRHHRGEDDRISAYLKRRFAKP